MVDLSLQPLGGAHDPKRALLSHVDRPRAGQEPQGNTRFCGAGRRLPSRTPLPAAKGGGQASFKGECDSSNRASRQRLAAEATKPARKAFWAGELGSSVTSRTPSGAWGTPGHTGRPRAPGKVAARSGIGATACPVGPRTPALERKPEPRAADCGSGLAQGPSCSRPSAASGWRAVRVRPCWPQTRAPRGPLLPLSVPAAQSRSLVPSSPAPSLGVSSFFFNQFPKKMMYVEGVKIEFIYDKSKLWPKKTQKTKTPEEATGFWRVPVRHWT